MSARTNLAQARVEHLLRSAALSKAHGQELAAARFCDIAAELLETRKIPNADTYRARLADLTGVPA